MKDPYKQEFEWLRAGHWKFRDYARVRGNDTARIAELEAEVERLRGEAELWRSAYDHQVIRANDAVEEHGFACAQRDRLAEVLMPFASVEVGGLVDTLPPEEVYLWKRNSNVREETGISLGDIKRARAALAELEEQR